MAKRQRVRRGDRLLTAVFALIGATAGVLWFLVNSDGPDAVVMTVVAQPSPHLRMDASLSVVFFGQVGYTRTAPDASTFDAELAFWHWAPPVVAVVVGAAAGGFVGWLAARWSRWSRRPQDAEPGAAADPAPRAGPGR